MITLYVKTGCPFCAAVLNKVEELGIEIEEKNVADEGVADELIALGGKKQMPYMVDTESGVSMYESSDIIDHLEKRFGGGDGSAAAGGAAATCPVE